jgi:hypothetical protein
MTEATATAESPKLYAFDEQEHIISINVRPTGKPLIVRHKLRKPTFAELETREKKQTAESVTKGNEEFIEGAGSGPDLELWNKLALGVQGYRLPGDEQPTASAGEDFWHQSPMLAQLIPAAHKLAAIRSLYDAEYELIGADDDADVFVIGATECRVRQMIHGFEIIHTLREMSEQERVEFERKSMQASFVRGRGKDVRTRIQGNLKAFVELYDRLMTRVEGGDGDKPAIDPIFKRGVINAMLAAQAAVLSD